MLPRSSNGASGASIWRTVTVDLRRVVGGLIARDAVLNALLLNHADCLQQGALRHGLATAPCFIVPSWSGDHLQPAMSRSRMFRVEAHTSRTDPRLRENLDAILRRVHAVLTDERSRSCIAARCLNTAPEPWATGFGTVVKVGVWDIVLVPPGPGTTRQRRAPWPDLGTSVVAAHAPAAGTINAN
jgi:hypothetical protein